MIKLFASDLDGTILYGFGPDEYCLETIQKIIDEGKYFAITTGRPLFKNQAKSTGFMGYDVYYICMNGSLIRNSGFETVYEEPISRKAMEELLDAFPVSHMEYTTANGLMVTMSKEEYVEYRLRDKDDMFAKGDKLDAFMENITFNATREDILNANIIKINGRFIDEYEQFREVSEYCRNHSVDLNNTPYRPDWCEITSSKASKALAVKKLAQILGLKEEEVAVFGDAENDLSMLMAFENAYVPENAIDEAKKHAKEITAPCNEHGILNKMRQLLSEE